MASLWTQNEIELMRKNLHLTDKELAKLVNRTEIGVMKKRRKLGMVKSQIKHSMNMNFFKQWSSEMAYVLGFIFADGNIYVRKSGSTFGIKIKDKQLLIKINKIMNSTYPIKERDTPTGKNYQLRFFRKEITNDLIKLGVTPNKSKTMRFPFVPTKYFFHFARGYIDGDGHVGLCNGGLRIAVYSGSQIFMEVLQKKLENKGIKSSLSRRIRDKGYISFRLYILSENKKFLCEQLYKNAPIYLERKYRIIKDYYDKRSIISMITCADCGILTERKAPVHYLCKECGLVYEKLRKLEWQRKNRRLKLIIKIDK